MRKEFVRTEIGSEFWDVPVGGSDKSLFPEGTRWFISGTGALEYIVSDIKKSVDLKTVGVPSWCCSCMIEPFLKAGAQVVFYPVYVEENGGLACDYDVVSSCDATLILKYFGYDNMQVHGCPGGVLIRDLTHSLLVENEEEDADYYFGSLRKWVGVWTGGYAWKQKPWEENDQILSVDPQFLQWRQQAMTMKLAYLLGKSQEKEYLSWYEKAEDFLDQCGVMGSCDRDIQCAKTLSVEDIRNQRRKNAQILLKWLKPVALFPQIEEQDCPMFVPILLSGKEKRDGLRRFLIGKEIYCPVHWHVSDLHALGERERYLYDHSLSIVCDQRYDEEDMIRIAEAIMEYGLE